MGKKLRGRLWGIKQKSNTAEAFNISDGYLYVVHISLL